jgi:superfamily I DNA and/or RNA helicase
VAVDNILERLVCAPSVQVGTSVKVTPRAVRLGHPARVSEAIQSHCLDALISTDEGTEIVGDVRKDIDDNRKYFLLPSQVVLTLQSSFESKGEERQRSSKRVASRNSKPSQGDQKARGESASFVSIDLASQERVVRNIMESRNVVLSTLVGASSRQLRGVQFDMVIIDEAAQALEVACWIPMLHASKV